MNMIEFGQACQVYNKEYLKLFGTIPIQSDFACTREEFYEALVKSVEGKKRIETLLEKAADLDMSHFDY